MFLITRLSPFLLVFVGKVTAIPQTMKLKNPIPRGVFPYSCGGFSSPRMFVLNRLKNNTMLVIFSSR